MRELTPRALQARLQADSEPPLLLDVREPWEFQICHLQGAELIPMRQIIANLQRLDRHRETVVICHHGIRSYQVALYLERQGFTDVVNLRGGVEAWARDVDPSMPRY